MLKSPLSALKFSEVYILLKSLFIFLFDCHLPPSPGLSQHSCPTNPSKQWLKTSRKKNKKIMGIGNTHSNQQTGHTVIYSVTPFFVVGQGRAARFPKPHAGVLPAEPVICMLFVFFSSGLSYTQLHIYVQ